MAEETFQRLDALLVLATRLAGSTPSGRVPLAGLARSTRPEWIPQPWGNSLLAELRTASEAAAVPMPLERVERTLREAWGVAPSRELDELESEPWLLTPVTQVHRASLEGREVAVRVLRQDMLRSVRQDLAVLDGLAGALGAAFPALDTLRPCGRSGSGSSTISISRPRPASSGAFIGRCGSTPCSWSPPR